MEPACMEGMVELEGGIVSPRTVTTTAPNIKTHEMSIFRFERKLEKKMQIVVQ